MVQTFKAINYTNMHTIHCLYYFKGVPMRSSESSGVSSLDQKLKTSLYEQFEYWMNESSICAIP